MHSIQTDPTNLVAGLALASGFVVLEVINIIYLKFVHNKVFGNEKYKDNDLNFMSFYKKYRFRFTGDTGIKSLAAFLLGMFFMIMTLNKIL